MDTSNQENYNSSIKEFVGKKQTKLFNLFRQNQFSGEVVFTDSNGSQWQFYFSLGRLICATGGEHSVRRWRRHLAIYLPEIAQDASYLEQQIKSLSQQNIHFCWEYEILRHWIVQGRASRESVIKMVVSITTEVFFDLNQSTAISYQVNENISIPMEEQISLFDATDFIVSAWKQWQKWISEKLGDRSPNKAPIIIAPDHLKEKVTAKTYELFVKLFNGRNTLRDLSIKLKKDIYQLSSSLLPYIQDGLIQLVSVPDLPSPIAQSKTTLIPENAPVVVCIDDSPMICETMRTLLVKAGYKFVGITEPLKAISKLISLKPDLIFLDLMMPNTNGYEICAELRKSSVFKNTPIIILTSNDGMIERVRSKMTGASDFMAKPINAQLVLSTIRKHLLQSQN